MPTVDDDMRRLSIQRITYRIKRFQLCQGVCHMQQRTIPIMAGSFMKKCRGNVQINHPPGFVKPLAILRFDHNAPPRRQYDAF